MKLRKINKRAGIESEGVIIWIIVISVVILAIIFISKMDLSSIMKNLPSFKGAGEEDKIIDIDIETDICSEGYELVGYFERGKEENFLYIGSEEEFSKIDIYLESGTNKIKLKRNWKDYHLGEKIIGNKEIIKIDQDLFNRYSNLFKEIISIELKESKEILYSTALINDSEIKSANIVCQKKESIESINKILNELYFNEKDIEIIDLTGETMMRTTRETIEIARRFLSNEKKEVITINLANHIYYSAYRDYPKLKKLVVIKEKDLLNIYQYSDKKIWPRVLFKIDSQGFLWFNSEKLELKEIRSTTLGNLEAVYIADNDYFGWTLDKKLKISSGAKIENFIKTPLLVNKDQLVRSFEVN
jgi:hypothetical protein